MKKILNFSVFTTLFTLFSFVMPASADRIKVVASLPPIHSLVAGVMAGVGVPRLLVQDGQSPHTYFMKPSNARMLNEAQVIFWVGPKIEEFLVKSLAALSQETSIVGLAKQKDSVSNRLNYDNTLEKRAKRYHDHQDSHIWLDPRKAVVMVGAIADALSLVDTANADSYRKNEGLIVARLALLEAELLETLRPVAGAPFLVFHDAYVHFQDRFGLASQGAVALSIDRPPGAQRISFLRRRILNSKIVCIFTEPQFTPAIAKTLIEGTSVRMGMLDPLGIGLDYGPSLYSVLMKRLANSFLNCLSASS